MQVHKAGFRHAVLRESQRTIVVITGAACPWPAVVARQIPAFSPGRTGDSRLTPERTKNIVPYLFSSQAPKKIDHSSSDLEHLTGGLPMRHAGGVAFLI